MFAKVPKRVYFTATVTRADGTVDDYGVVMDKDWGWFRKWRAKRRIQKINRKAGVPGG